ncbi:hypothetical protein HYY74_03120 [Candidatus Woesearchaeota archaeon]|nr:hypothetical protein [Candidatus Woesearchaeota archaeon]
MATQAGKIILIVVAVMLIISAALAAFIFSVADWSRTYVEETRQDVSPASQAGNACKHEAGVKPLMLAGRIQACLSEYDEQYLLNITVVNDGLKQIEGLKVRAIGTEGINDGDIAVKIPVNGRARLSYLFAKYVGRVEVIRVMPIVNLQGQPVVCSNRESVMELNASSLPACEEEGG